jgi:plasmid stabilization system protein ParE
MKIVVREKADADLDRIFDWIVQRNPRAATEMIRRIRARIGKLVAPNLARMGRPRLEVGTRELIEPPYIIVYEVHEAQDEVHILYIVHGAQDRERED